MSRFRRFVDAVLSHSRIAIVVMLALTAVIGAGAPMVDQASSLDQFQSDTVEAEKLDYVDQNFAGTANTTTVQIVVRGDDVLSRESLIAMLEYQQNLRQDEQIRGTLTGEDSTVGVPNAVATAAITQERAQELQAAVEEFESAKSDFEDNETAVEQRGRELNATADDLQAALDVLRANPDASVEAQFEEVRANTSVELDDEDFATFREAAKQVREAERQQEIEEAYRLGTEGVLAEEYEALAERSQALEREGERVAELGETVEDKQAALENASDATLDEQIEQLRSMNDSEVEAIVSTVLGEDADDVLALMPTSYEPGETSANATVLIVNQQSSAANPNAVEQEVIDAQLAMKDVGDGGSGLDYAVFGTGVVSDEIDSSMTDSLRMVAPMALLFVLLTLTIAYRDPVDILLGVVGIAIVLVWTFGFMGWAGINFNQLFVAVPVLLIGLSIDYAIHVFMRHREERAALDDEGDHATLSDVDGESATGGESGRTASEYGEEAGSSRYSMRVALSGVGLALVWVTATTIIGFLSNLISPVEPIRQFGVVSSFGIVAALLVFGVLTPALKVHIDELLARWGLDRQRRAFGTGGGAFSRALSIGAIGARRAPMVVVLLVLAVSAGGVYGATQVDTSFAQEDFLAEDPPEWTERLPESIQPGEYTVKSHLQYVNENFVREDTQAQILVEGDVTSDDALQRLDAAQSAAAEKSVTQYLANGDPAIRSPLTFMNDVAAANESFAQTFEAADTDGDGVPDQNVEAVYDELFRLAPDRAAEFVHRTDDGEYVALRMVVGVQGGADGSAVTEQMRDVAATVDGDGLTATATGNVILNDIVQGQLLDTVIESLLVSLVAVVAFLMIVYRFTHGSATLGLVTLLPVVLTVSWILGTMYLLGVPFNVMTGMITSLTIGLGVAYSIHISERYNQELPRHDSVWTAMRTAVTGTGGALLGSAATTVGGFGVLLVAILPPLQQFGLITGLTIVYAFLAAVLVLPSLLVIWTRLFGPEDAREQIKGQDVDRSEDPSPDAAE